MTGSAVKVKYTVFNTKIGWVVLGGSENGLRFITLPRSSPEDALTGLDCLMGEAVREDSGFGDLPSRLQRYFVGEMLEFPDQLDYKGASAFEQAAWNVTRSIPYGEVRSYAWVAEQIGKPRAYRAVGRAMSRNRFPIVVPCHRVIASDGSLGGFGGGLQLKQRLIDMEKNRVSRSN